MKSLRWKDIWVSDRFAAQYILNVCFEEGRVLLFCPPFLLCMFSVVFMLGTIVVSYFELNLNLNCKSSLCSEQ